MNRLAQFLKATGRRLGILAHVICHFFRRGKLGLKIAIKIPFFVEVEISYERDGNPSRMIRQGPLRRPRFRTHDAERRRLQFANLTALPA